MLLILATTFFFIPNSKSVFILCSFKQASAVLISQFATLSAQQFMSQSICCSFPPTGSSVRLQPFAHFHPYLDWFTLFTQSFVWCDCARVDAYVVEQSLYAREFCSISQFFTILRSIKCYLVVGMCPIKSYALYIFTGCRFMFIENSHRHIFALYSYLQCDLFLIFFSQFTENNSLKTTFKYLYTAYYSSPPCTVTFPPLCKMLRCVIAQFFFHLLFLEHTATYVSV